MSETTERLDAIEAQLAGITQGPWRLEHDNADDYEAGINDGDYPYAIHGPHNVSYEHWSAAWKELHADYLNRVSEISEMTDSDATFIASAPDTIRELLTLARKQAAALDELMYVANHKAADTQRGQWWAEVIRGPIVNHLGAEAASHLGAEKEQAYIVECDDLGPGDQIWFSSLFEAEHTCGPFPSCCVPTPVGPDYDGPKWVPE